MVKGNYYEPLKYEWANTSEPQAIDKSEPEQHELTKAQRKNKQRAENRRLKREGLLRKPCEAVPTAVKPSVHTIQRASYVTRRVGPVEARVMILPNDIDLVAPLVFRQEKNLKLVGARHLARRFSVSWNTFASTILFASRGSSEWGLDHPLCNLHEPALRLIAGFAGVQHKAAVAEWLEVKESAISVMSGRCIQNQFFLENVRRQEGGDRIDTIVGRDPMIRCSIGAGIEVRDGSSVTLLGVTISDDTAAWDGEEANGIQAIGNGASLTLEDVHIIGGKGLGVFDGATARMIGGSVCGCTRHTLGAGTGWIEEGYGGAVTVTNGSTLSLSHDVLVEKSIRNGIYVNCATVELDATVTVRGSGHGVFERKAKRLHSPDFTGTKLGPDGDTALVEYMCSESEVLMFHSEDGRYSAGQMGSCQWDEQMGTCYPQDQIVRDWCEYFPAGPSPDGVSSCDEDGIPCVFLLTSIEGYIAGGADYYQDGHRSYNDYYQDGGFVGVDQGLVYKGRFMDDFYSV
jgi:hypothetical protein